MSDKDRQKKDHQRKDKKNDAMRKANPEKPAPDEDDSAAARRQANPRRKSK